LKLIEEVGLEFFLVQVLSVGFIEIDEFSKVG
jgi:hypothetical protein